MKTLKQICLNSICDNLYYNYEIFSEKSIKVPKKIGQEIMENAYVVVKEFDDFDLKFFQHDITGLESVDLEKKPFANVTNFEFLNGHNLYDFNIGFLQSVRNKSFRLTSKNMIINGFGRKLDQRGRIISNCFITESIEIRNPDDIYGDFEALSSLFKNASESLKVVNLKSVYIPLQRLNSIAKLLREKCQLEKFSASVHASYYSSHRGKGRELELLQPICENLTDIEIEANDYLVRDITKLAKKMTRLRSLTTCASFDKSPVVNDFLRSIKLHIGPRLKEICLNFRIITPEINKLLIDALKFCTQLTKITLTSNDSENYLTSKIFNSLIPCSKTLTSISLDFNDWTKYDDGINEFLNGCSELKKFPFDIFFGFKANPKSISRAITQSKDSINSMELNNFVLSDNIIGLINIPPLPYLTDILFKSMQFESNSVQLLFKALEGSAPYLESITWVGCELNRQDIEWIANFLSKCQRLKSIGIVHYFMQFRFLHTIFSSLLTSSSETMEKFTFFQAGIEDEDIIAIIPLLKDFTELKVLNFMNNQISDDSAIPLANNFKKHNKKVEILELRNTFASDIIVNQLYSFCKGKH